MSPSSLPDKLFGKPVDGSLDEMLKQYASSPPDVESPASGSTSELPHVRVDWAEGGLLYAINGVNEHGAYNEIRLLAHNVHEVIAKREGPVHALAWNLGGISSANVLYDAGHYSDASDSVVQTMKSKVYTYSPLDNRINGLECYEGSLYYGCSEGQIRQVQNTSLLRKDHAGIRAMTSQDNRLLYADGQGAIKDALNGMTIQDSKLQSVRALIDFKGELYAAGIDDGSFTIVRVTCKKPSSIPCEIVGRRSSTITALAQVGNFFYDAGEYGIYHTTPPNAFPAFPILSTSPRDAITAMTGCNAVQVQHLIDYVNDQAGAP